LPLALYMLVRRHCRDLLAAVVLPVLVLLVLLLLAGLLQLDLLRDLQVRKWRLQALPELALQLAVVF
jgi:hypothetical protein